MANCGLFEIFSVGENKTTEARRKMAAGTRRRIRRLVGKCCESENVRRFDQTRFIVIILKIVHSCETFVTSSKIYSYGIVFVVG